jgi:hypothetical protein
MENPYQTPASVAKPTQRKAVPPVVVALVCLLLGYVTTPFVWFWLFPAPKSCPPPCDGPAYALMGLLLFVGPIVGVILAVFGYIIQRDRLRRRARAAA